jgi:hypothetical protein
MKGRAEQGRADRGNDQMLLRKRSNKGRRTLPEKLSWMIASDFMLDAVIQSNLVSRTPSKSIANSKFVAQAFGNQVSIGY